MDKAVDAFRTISEVAEDLDLPQHVLRFWETKFTQIKPLKRGGGRRYYRPDDVDLLRGIRYLLYGQGYTIKGVQRIIKDHGPKAIIAAWLELSAQDAAAAKVAPAPAPASAADAAEEQLLAESSSVSEALFASVQTLSEDEADASATAEPSRPSYQQRADVSIMRGGLSGKGNVRKPAATVGVGPFAPLTRANLTETGASERVSSADESGKTLELTSADSAALMNVLQDLAECRRILDTAGRK